MSDDSLDARLDRALEDVAEGRVHPAPEFELLATTDAQVWAHEFMNQIADGKVVDDAMMTSWFANAIETGREAGRKLIATPVEEDEEDLNLRY